MRTNSQGGGDYEDMRQRIRYQFIFFFKEKLKLKQTLFNIDRYHFFVSGQYCLG